MNIAIVLGLLVVLAALAAAGFFMVRGGGNTDEGLSADNAEAQRKRMAKALTVRIGVSVLLFLAILLAWHFGVIKPSGLPVGK